MIELPPSRIAGGDGAVLPLVIQLLGMVEIDLVRIRGGEWRIGPGIVLLESPEVFAVMSLTDQSLG